MHDEHELKKRRRRRLLVESGGLLAVLIALAVFLGFHRKNETRDDARARDKTQNAGRAVEIATVKPSETEHTLLLIGEARPYYSVTLYARVSGYLDRLLVDIGDQVKKGQLLAHVESPEQEQAYNSARADAVNKRRIAERTRILRRRRLISQQQEDQAVSDAEVSEANLRTQGVIRQYQEIVAPFDGVISNRYVDPGWLLQNASGSQSASQPLFTVTQSNRLRVFVYVDQKDAPYVQANDPVDVSVPGQAGQNYSSKISMIAGELDPKTRTLLAEFIMDNPDGKIVAGSYVRVHMTVKMPQFLMLPVQALVMRGEEPYVPLVNPDGTVHYTKIDLAGNDGENILIRSGVHLGDRVAVNVGNTIVDGQKLRPIAMSGKPGEGGKQLEGKSQSQAQTRETPPQPRADAQRAGQAQNQRQGGDQGKDKGDNFDEDRSGGGGAS